MCALTTQCLVDSVQLAHRAGGREVHSDRAQCFSRALPELREIDISRELDASRLRTFDEHQIRELHAHALFAALDFDAPAIFGEGEEHARPAVEIRPPPKAADGAPVANLHRSHRRRRERSGVLELR
jgi:hypothetical protein